jgi:uncharacterized protein involved in exopolysaccharide biosynthesis
MSWHEMLNIVLFNIKTIIKITIISTAFVFLILLFVYPRTYSSTVVVLPPEKNSSMDGLGSILAGKDLSDLFTASISNASSQLFVEILKSRSASLYVINKLKIQKLYDEKDINNAAKLLSDDLRIDINKEGMIKLNVLVNTTPLSIIFDNESTKKKLSADLSNTFIEALDKINRDKLTSKSKRSRIFIEEQLQIVKVQLDSVENALMDFQRRNKAISLPDQIKSSIEAAANIKSEIAKLEIKLGLMGYDFYSDNKSYQFLLKELDQLRQQYAKIEIDNQDYFLAFKDVPALGKELSALVREVKIKNELYLLLQQQYYKDKIQENRDLPTIEILDPAVVPNKKTSPRTLFSAIVSSVAVFLFVSFYFCITNRKRIQQKNNI